MSPESNKALCGAAPVDNCDEEEDLFAYHGNMIHNLVYLDHKKEKPMRLRSDQRLSTRGKRLDTLSHTTYEIGTRE